MASEAVQLRQDLLEARGQIDSLQRQTQRKGSEDALDSGEREEELRELREALSLTKKNMEELETLYTEKEKEVIMLQKYLDECQAINGRLRQIADKNDQDIQHILKERDTLREKCMAGEKQIGALRKLLRQSERLLGDGRSPPKELLGVSSMELR